MPSKRDNYRPCSDLDLRAAALRATHERLHELDEQGKPTIGMFGQIEREEKAKLRAYGEYMAKKGTNPVMTWHELKTAVAKFANSNER
jgi:hypothetical protein